MELLQSLFTGASNTSMYSDMIISALFGSFLVVPLALK